MTTISQGASGELIVNSTSDGGLSCPIRYTASGYTVTIVPGQSCMSRPGVTANFTTATATLSGATFTGMSTYTFAGTAMAEGPMLERGLTVALGSC